MSRRRKNLKEIEVHHLIENPPARRSKSEVGRVLDLLDRISREIANKEEAT